jgi:hypothetical protein
MVGEHGFKFDICSLFVRIGKWGPPSHPLVMMLDRLKSQGWEYSFALAPLDSVEEIIADSLSIYQTKWRIA